MAEDQIDLEALRLKYPASRGWDVFPLGNKILAVNRWGGARKVVHTRPLIPEERIPIPESWRYKPRTR
jgi:hypothetical protein